MFQHVYLGPAAQRENTRAAAMVEALFAHHLSLDPDPAAVTDWVAGMTDRYALRAFQELPA
jgi:dGTPase